MAYKKVRNEPPISSLFQYEIVGSKIKLDLSNKKLDSKYHNKSTKNSILWALILFSKHGTGRLKKIQFSFGANITLKNRILPLLTNQAEYFRLDVSPKKPSSQFEFKDVWAQGIRKATLAEVGTIETKLKASLKADSKKLQFYKTVTGSRIQIRFKGYQIGEWDGSRIKPINNKKVKTFVPWAKDLMKERANPTSRKYASKAEHYLESLFLKEQYGQGLKIYDKTIKPIFPKSKVAFQFPALMYGGKTDKDSNPPNYIDVMGTAGNRPVIIELKVWNKNNSRGQYLFEAISQVLCYYHYYYQLRRDSKSNLKNQGKLWELDWKHPILVVAVNDLVDVGKSLATDKTAQRFLEYFGLIKSYFKSNIEFHFVEVDNKKWQKRQVEIIPSRI